jgi:hypothetical protein
MNAAQTSQAPAVIEVRRSVLPDGWYLMRIRRVPHEPVITYWHADLGWHPTRLTFYATEEKAERVALELRAMEALR